MLGFRRQLAFLLQFLNGGGISGGLISVEFPGKCPITESLDTFTRKPFGGFGVASGGEVEINGMAVFFDSPVVVGPFPFDFDIGFIQPPARTGGSSPVPTQPFFNQRGIMLDPAVKRGMIFHPTFFTAFPPIPGS